MRSGSGGHEADQAGTTGRAALRAAAPEHPERPDPGRAASRPRGVRSRDGGQPPACARCAEAANAEDLIEGDELGRYAVIPFTLDAAAAVYGRLQRPVPRRDLRGERGPSSRPHARDAVVRHPAGQTHETYLLLLSDPSRMR